MNCFRYIGCDGAGAMTSGTLWARGSSDARALLDAMSIHVLELHPYSPVVARLRGESKSRLSILRSLAAQLGAGVPLRAALASAEQAHVRGAVAAGLRDVRRMISEGEQLGDSLQRAGLANATSASIIRIGEAVGTLARTLQLAVAQLEREEAVVARLRAALTYPAILAVTACFSLIVIVLVVLPRFAEIVSEVGGRPPALAIPMLTAAAAIREHSSLATGILAALVLTVAAALGSAGRREQGRTLLLRSRAFAPMYQRWTAARVSHELATLLNAGMPASRAMAELIRTRKDERVADVLRDALARISNGERLATALIASGALPISIQPLLQVGEQTAQLGEMLQHAGTELDRELERTIDTSLTLLQPAIVLAFGGIIALVAGAVMQTLYSVRPSM